MNSIPVVSVIMPVYNSSLYIEEAVQSILNQTFTDFELIIIDDASTDGTTQIIKKFTDSRIKIIRFDINKGVSKATNVGFEKAKGKYIARMDADDISLKKRLEQQVAVLDANPRILICGSLVKYLGGNNKIITFKETHPEIITELLISCSVYMGASMFRRQPLNGYFFDEQKVSGEDYDFWTKVAWLGEMYNIQKVLLLYRVHDNQASKKHKKQQILDDINIRLYLFKKIKFDNIKYTDALISKMLLLNELISINDLELFLDWIKDMILLNSKSEVYPQKEFQKVLNRIKKDLLFSLYFKKTTIGIDKKWRKRALMKLPMMDALYILKIKTRERAKTLIKKL